MKLIIFNETLTISESTNFISMVTDSRHREKTFWIEKKQQKKHGIQNNISESKIFQNRENYFKIEQNVSESRNSLLLESIKNLELNDLKFNEPPS